MAESNRITVWGDPKEEVTVEIGNNTVKSGYGSVTYKEWCALEVARMKKKGLSVRVIENESGQICISR